MIQWTQQDIDDDLLFFVRKLANEKDPARQAKLQNQIELLEDAIVVYGPRRGLSDVGV